MRPRRPRDGPRAGVTQCSQAVHEAPLTRAPQHAMCVAACSFCTCLLACVSACPQACPATQLDDPCCHTGRSPVAVEDVVALLRMGQANRRVGETNMNERSSRSHR